MTIQSRLARVLDRLSTATSVQRTRSEDQARAQRNGDAMAQDVRLETAITRLEAVADELWEALESKPSVTR